MGPTSDQDSPSHLSPVLTGWLQGLTCWKSILAKSGTCASAWRNPSASTTVCGSSWNIGSAPLPAGAVGEAPGFLFLVVTRVLLKGGTWQSLAAFTVLGYALLLLLLANSPAGPVGRCCYPHLVDVSEPREELSSQQD